MKDILFTVAYNKPLFDRVHEIRLESSEDLPDMHCGQFLHLEVKDVPTVLRRPFCLYKFDRRSVTIIVANVGKGSARICAMRVGETARAIVPIGNGFRLEEKHKKVALIGGGVGCAPLAALGACYPGREFRSYIGFAKKSAVCFESDFAAFSKTTVCTDDGSYGYHGYPTDALAGDDFTPDVILTCGSMPLVKAVARLSAETGIPAYMSGESHMGCGVGACLVCVCALKNEKGEIEHKRACVDGPVFDLKDLVL